MSLLVSPVGAGREDECRRELLEEGNLAFSLSPITKHGRGRSVELGAWGCWASVKVCDIGDRASATPGVMLDPAVQLRNATKSPPDVCHGAAQVPAQKALGFISSYIHFLAAGLILRQGVAQVQLLHLLVEVSQLFQLPTLPDPQGATPS